MILTLLLLLLFISTYQLSTLYMPIQDESYESLVSQQRRFEAKVQKLIENTNLIKKSLQESQNNEQKTSILQKAIKNSMQTIFDASKELQVNLTMAENICTEFSEENRTKYTEKLDKIKLQFKKISQMTQKMPQCQETSIIRSQLEKQQNIINSLEKTLKLKCNKHYLEGQTKYQTNIQSKLWILGSLEMDDLIDMFFSKAFSEVNITNCPKDNPFFNGSSCMNCSEELPYFDISLNKCVSCDGDYEINLTIRKCVPAIKNTNYSAGYNYVLGALPYLPPDVEGKKLCPEDRPFFNGTFCEACPLPIHYWNLQTKKCLKCREQTTVFNMNEKKCVILESDKLTRLFGQDSKWVTNDGNITRVLTERLNYLKEHPQTNFTQCPLINPYYDGIACVSCTQQFNVDTLRCSSPPQNFRYNRNMRKYLQQEQNKQTDPNAPNYVTISTLTDTESIENCNATHPYFDGIACILCQFPFPIFNYNNQQCMACDAAEVYNQTAHSCSKRQWVYVQVKQDRLLATRNYSVEDYLAEMKQALKDKPEALAVECESKNQFSALDSCVRCQDDEVFNMESRQCAVCEGEINQTTHYCMESVKYLTNLHAPFIIFTTISKSEAISEVQKLKNIHPVWEECPMETPFADASQTQCFQCDGSFPLYSYSTKTCTTCPDETQFIQLANKCQSIIYQSNLDGKLLIESPETILSYEEKQKKQGEGFIVRKCPLDKPFTNNNKACLSCFPPADLFNTTDNLCTSCPPNTEYLLDSYSCNKVYYLTDLTATGIIQSHNYTIQNVRNQQEKTKKQNVYEQCSGDKPYGYETACTGCIQKKTYFNLETRSCEYCPSETQYWQHAKQCLSITYVTNLDADVKFIEDKDSTVEALRDDIARLRGEGPVHVCPDNKPYSVRNQCVFCSSRAYFNLLLDQCVQCSSGYVYQPRQRSCVKLFFKTNVQELGLYVVGYDDWGTVEALQRNISTLEKSKPTETCPSNLPYSSGSEDCFSCPSERPYLFLGNFTCISCLNFISTSHTCPPKPFHYPNLTNFRWITQKNAADIIANALKQKQQNGATMCPQFYMESTRDCITCEPDEYFNYDTSTCVTCDAPKVFDINIHQCTEAQPQGTHYTNLYNIKEENVIFGGLTENEIVFRISQAKEKYPGSSVCPPEQPYFDGTKCINCPSYKKYFNLRYALCQLCLQGQDLDLQSHNCIDSSGAPVWSEPNAQKVYPFLFGESTTSK